MRVAVKNMSGVFIHSTTPRKARLLLKEKKAVIESNDPFTIRLLFSASECGMKDFNSSNKNTSGLLLPEKDNTMCGNEETNVLVKKWDSKTHLIFGAIGCGKTTLLAKLVRDKLNNGERVARVLYTKNKDVHSKLFHAENGAFCTLVEFRGKDTYSPVEASNYLIKTCEFPASNTTIVLDDMNRFLIHGDYDHQEYFREFSRVCREKNIDFICTLGVDSDKNEVYHKLPEIYARFSDIITVLK